MALNSYFDFAENDFQYFKASYDAGIVANMMGAMAQGICEKYMKHLISEYYKPDDAIQQKDFENILRTHSLNRLMKFLKGNMVTVHTPLSREVFWHEYAKIPRHMSQNSIAAGNRRDYHGFLFKD